MAFSRSAKIGNVAIDIDTDDVKEQVADLAQQAKGASAAAAAKASDAAVHAKEWTTPKVEAFIDWLLPRVEHLYKESVKAAAPKVEQAAEAVTPAIDTAHEKLVDDLLPKLVQAMNDAAVRAGAAVEHAADAAAAKSGAAAAVVAAVAAEQAEEAERRHTGAKVFWTVVGLLGVGAAVAAWRHSRDTVDPWAEPWEPTDAFGGTTPDTLRERAHDARTEFAGAAGDAADALGEAAGTAVAKGREAASKAGERASDAKDKATDALADAKDAAAETARKVTRRAAPKKPTDDEDASI